MVYRLILAEWAKKQGITPDVLEGDFTKEELEEYNTIGYNCYWLPNEPTKYKRGVIVEGKHIDKFRFCFVDLDMKDFQNKDPKRRHDYPDKATFIKVLQESDLKPTAIVDSGNGIHAYWEVSGLDAMTFLRLQRRLYRKFHTDPAVAKIYQLMRVPETVNVKDPDNFKLCEVVDSTGNTYDLEQMNGALPPITQEDEGYCKSHFNKTYQVNDGSVRIAEELPQNFQLLLTKNKEVKRLFFGPVQDRSAADYRLAHILAASGLTKDEARTVLYNSAKAIERAPVHRYNYANDIIEKVWLETQKPGNAQSLSKSIMDILNKNEAEAGDRFPCAEFVDATIHGYRLGEVLGLVGGPGSGKTNIAFNMFRWFAERNPNYIHVFVNLEEQEKDLARRWVKLVGDNKVLHNVVRIITNYNEDGTCRELSLEEIKGEVQRIEKETGKKVGCVVVDHIGALKHSSKDAEFEGLIGLCKEMKPFAVSTKTFFIIQSHANRDKAGPYNDIELNMDAAYGTSQFERWVDYLMTTWQPLSRVYGDYTEDTLYVQAFKFCKIRVMDALNDKIKRNDIYALKFDSTSGALERMTDDDYRMFTYWDSKAANQRNRDRKQPTRPLKRFTWL